MTFTVSQPDPCVFIALPAHDGRADTAAANAALMKATQRWSVIPMANSCGALAHNFNIHLAVALNNREEQNIRWFAMLHSDVHPDDYWVDTLIEQAEAHDADLMAAVVPIKDKRGLTSTAIDDPDTHWAPWCRLTTAQVNHEDFPKTFDGQMAAKALAMLPEPFGVICPDGANLLANVGCMVMRLDSPFADDLYFDVADRIVKIDGKFQAQFDPDDWRISRRITALGGRVMSTSLVVVAHRGSHDFRSDEVWGSAIDRQAMKLVRAEPAIT